jgi:hypothetical protein
LEYAGDFFFFLAPFISKPATAYTYVGEWCISYKIWSPVFRAADVIAAVSCWGPMLRRVIA